MKVDSFFKMTVFWFMIVLVVYIMVLYTCIELLGYREIPVKCLNCVGSVCFDLCGLTVKILSVVLGLLLRWVRWEQK